MQETNLALYLPPLENSEDLGSIMIGPSNFCDDTWDLRQFIPERTTAAGLKYLRFSYISSASIKNTVKLYAYYKLGKVKPKTVIGIIDGNLPAFVEYCEEYNIQSLCVFTKEDFLNFNIWLKDNKKIAPATGQRKASVVAELFRVGQIKGWDVPQTNILQGLSPKDLWNAYDATYSRKTKPIPPDVFDRILHHAIYDEEDIILKAGIIIQSQTGLRISEVFSIQEGCLGVSFFDGQPYDYIEVLIRKTSRGDPQKHKVFINSLTKTIVEELSAKTKQYRNRLGVKELFTYKHRTSNKVSVMTTQTWSMWSLPYFCSKWNICDKDGNPYHLTSHQFRATFVRELVKQKVPISMIMKQYAHVSIEMTSHYLTLQEDEVKEIYTDMIFSPESRIAGLRAKEIKEKLDGLFHGKTREEIDEVISNLTKTMSFNPLPTGVCLYDFRRGNCTDGDGCFMYNCPNYITEVQFYPILKKELDLLEAEMTRLKDLGQERQWQREYVKYKYLKPLVDDLEVQIGGEKNI